MQQSMTSCNIHTVSNYEQQLIVTNEQALLTHTNVQMKMFRYNAAIAVDRS